MLIYSTLCMRLLLLGHQNLPAESEQVTRSASARFAFWQKCSAVQAGHSFSLAWPQVMMRSCSLSMPWKWWQVRLQVEDEAVTNTSEHSFWTSALMSGCTWPQHHIDCFHMLTSYTSCPCAGFKQLPLPTVTGCSHFVSREERRWRHAAADATASGTTAAYAKICRVCLDGSSSKIHQTHSAVKQDSSTYSRCTPC